MESSTTRDMMLLCPPDEAARKNLHAQDESEANTDICLLKSSTPNLLQRVGALSTRSDSPSTVESVCWDQSSAVYSEASPASFKDDLFIETELNVTERCGRSSDSDDGIRNPPQIPDIHDFHNVTPSTRNADEKRILSNNNNNDNTSQNRLRETGQSRHEETSSEFEDDDFDSDDEEDNDDWAGEPDKIETAVLMNVPDLEFAASLIMDLHKDRVHSEARRIGGWQKGVVTYQNSPGAGESSRQSFVNPNAGQRSSKSHKKQRLSRSRGGSSDDGDGERDDGEGSGSPENHDDGSISGEQRGRYACPFNKSAPTIFCSNPITGDQFRVCESGYKTIQRLKEHIKRKHLLIQCERCYKNFSGKGKAIEESVAELKTHRQQPEPCAVGSSESNSGINMEQWTLLDRSGGKKRKKISEVEKWFNIWETIFPEKLRPRHPWAERTTLGMKSLPVPANTQRFTNLFQKFLDHGIMSGSIQFIQGQELLMKSRLNSLAQKAYNLHMDLDDAPSLGNSSSSGQTATQIAMPTTPVINNPNMAQRHIPVPKMSRQNSQPMLIREPQAQYRILPPQIPPGMTYGPQNFPGYGGNQLTRVPPNPMPGPSQALVLDQPEFHWSYGNMSNSWPGFEYLPHMDAENPDLSYIQQNEQS
ncbi:hypothetical protein F5Y00DRAFT_272862 [Daldinia vernicosa]|uniref:uncharacterized protein n=1 Tax=Daldinia vernicosa TaxID=114800 RepID=UPI0020085567|nr:uncharacterized protein F5Y00DRAFT_272862 [Daldinia vernicosa]KAI0845426.1 hypothetical protein F5Y00DRAFT_272862 [Daldinia vernicosa]